MKYETKQNIILFFIFGLLILIWYEILDIISTPTEWFGSQSLTYTVDKLTHLIKIAGNGIAILLVILGILIYDYTKLRKRVKNLENHIKEIGKNEKER